ncbi:hypothetical protein BRADI_3g03541v3 [Brachypodium distachyon]|uniref:Uncharacterized protein n=1 Tax=Brachypodium distachyon TaxID=15368 RepID=A0A2K2CUY9_BRADI|nr:hypothetical protein BRADI_3g03541v3 [Brachypodium distachyon]PNT65852.1 hypothetical protein BRADI_3g03541v3 [Brachypodium distachyon]
MSSSFRRFVHLVRRDKRPHHGFWLRNIDTSRFFFDDDPPAPPHALPASPTALPPVAMSFCPPYLPGSRRDMDFMLLGGSPYSPASRWSDAAAKTSSAW